MRPQKITRDELLQRCANMFRRYGYHGTSMDMLASACALSKASFYHHYPNKESLARDVLDGFLSIARDTLFAVVYNDSLTPKERMAQMSVVAKKLFIDDAIGCLMGVMSVDTVYSAPNLMPPIQQFINDWVASLTHLFATQREFDEAQKLAWQAVTELEGAILLSRIYGNSERFDRVCNALLELLVD